MCVESSNCWKVELNTVNTIHNNNSIIQFSKCCHWFLYSFRWFLSWQLFKYCCFILILLTVRSKPCSSCKTKYEIISNVLLSSDIPWDNPRATCILWVYIPSPVTGKWFSCTRPPWMMILLKYGHSNSKENSSFVTIQEFCVRTYQNTMASPRAPESLGRKLLLKFLFPW